MTTEWLSILAVGFVLGMRHATDADHVIAVSTIAVRQLELRPAISVGGAWGAGHAMTIFTVGGAIILFGVQIAPELGLAFEFMVGATLVALGVGNLTDLGKWLNNGWTARRNIRMTNDAHAGVTHGHPHDHGVAIHSFDIPTPSPAGLGRSFGHVRGYLLARTFFVGIIHGLSGSAAAALLVLAAFHDKAWSMAYLLLFGLGTVAGMLLMTAAIAVHLRYPARWIPRSGAYIRVAAGLLSVAFGCALMVRIALSARLFIVPTGLFEVTAVG